MENLSGEEGRLEEKNHKGKAEEEQTIPLTINA